MTNDVAKFCMSHDLMQISSQSRHNLEAFY